MQCLLLKGNVLKDMNKIPEALLHFREAVRMAPHRFETHQGAYIVMFSGGSRKWGCFSGCSTQSI